MVESHISKSGKSFSTKAITHMFNMTLSVFFNDFTALHHTISYHKKYFTSQKISLSLYIKLMDNTNVTHMVFQTLYKYQPLLSATYVNIEEATVGFQIYIHALIFVFLSKQSYTS